jgi:hypothetical protein
MKTSFLFLFFFVSFKFSFGQSQRIIGAWRWSDSTTTISFFFNKDGSCSTHSGSKGEVILSKNTKKGTYSYAGEILTIKWDNSEIETNALKFIDENTIQISLTNKDKPKQKKQGLIFRRIFDEAAFEK